MAHQYETVWSHPDYINITQLYCPQLLASKLEPSKNPGPGLSFRGKGKRPSGKRTGPLRGEAGMKVGFLLGGLALDGGSLFAGFYGVLHLSRFSEGEFFEVEDAAGIVFEG